MAKLGNLKGATGATGASINGSGTFASRPAAGTAGRIYTATDVGAAYEDNGSLWLPVSPAGGIPKTTDVTSAIPGTSLTAIVTVGPFPAALMVAGTVVQTETYGVLTCTSAGSFTIDIGKTGNSSGGRIVAAPGTKSSVPFRLTARVMITASATIFFLEFVVGSTSTSTVFNTVQSTTLASSAWNANDTITLQTQNSASGVILTPSINSGRLVSAGA